MTDPHEDVKPQGRIARMKDWLECRPLTGWYLAVIGVMNLLLNIATLIVAALS